MSRIWKFKETAAGDISPELIAAADNTPILAKLLAIRGITTAEEAKAFLNLSEYQPASPTAFPDMEKALERIQGAIDHKEHILVYGDFDVDGITGTTVLMECLKTLNANVSYYIPDRHTEGHGLNSTALCRLVSSRQVKVVITTDTGSSNFNEVSLLKGLNVDTIITDHHEVPENLPPALAILTPKLLPSDSPLAYLAGVGVAYKLAEALMTLYNVPQSNIDALLDLVAIGTVVDMVPLLRENRYLVWRGLQVLERQNRLGIKTLLEEAGVNETAPISSQTLGFVIGPRLNAIGRLAHAHDAVELLTTQDPEQAKPLAAKLEHLNRQRKNLVEQALLQAETHLMSTGELSDQKAIILASKDWNPGVVGLVATKLIDKYYRPCFIGYMDDETQEVRFSARSIEGFDMHHNLCELEDLFIRWGGHSGAAGFSIAQKDLQKLKARLFKLCSERISDQQLTPITSVDMKLTPNQVNPFLINIVNKMAPFGQNNPLPVFGLEKVTIGAQRMLGEDQNHLKLVLTTGEPGQYLEAIHWNWGGDRPKLNPASTYRFAFTAELNTYNGTTKIQLLLKDYLDESRPEPQQPVWVSQPEPVDKKLVKENPAPSAPESSESAGVYPAWIDHRGRDEIESFLNQILLPASGQLENGTYRIFCEGTQPGLPFPVPDSLFCNRHNALPNQTVQNLVLWDLPPDMPCLIQLIQAQQPKIIHLIGGKYQKIPIYRQPREFLDGFLKVLQRLAKQQGEPSLTLTLPKLSTMLSTTQPVVLSGLSLLSRLNLLTASALPEKDHIRIQLVDSPAPLEDDISQILEYVTFKTALQEVLQFREWLMTAPITVIQSAVTMERSSSTTVLREGREHHAANIR